jgi:dGTPase
MNRHESVSRVRAKADQMVRALYAAYCERPSEMSAAWTARTERAPRQRVVADYIAGMTDRFAVQEYRRLFDPKADLR